MTQDPPVTECNVSFRVPVELALRFREVAAADDRTVSNELRRLMRQRIAEADKLAEVAA
jgi:hypothetical protein